jgi:hypothetical protein
MISVLLQGGLGNQLFQIATAYAHSLKVKDRFALFNNVHFLPLQGNHVNSYKDNLYRNIAFIEPKDMKVYNEQSFSYKDILKEKNICLRGYFQSEKYFKDNREDLFKLFDIENLRSRIAYNVESGTVSLHIRRGDYLKASDYHRNLPLSYYQEALTILKDSPVFIFSDDIEFCKKTFKGDRFTFVEGNKDYEDILLMSMCTHHIIANSSFSWWGAWMSSGKGTIIAPNPWFGPNGPKETQDLIPKDWLKL